MEHRDSLTAAPSFPTIETTEPTPPISELQLFAHVGSSHSIGLVPFQPTATQDFFERHSETPTEVDANERDTVCVRISFLSLTT